MKTSLQSGNSSDVSLASAKLLGPQLVAIRRHIHSHPELSFQEHGTVRFVEDELKKLGCTPRIYSGGIGISAEIGQGQALVVIRADMDALPIEEINQSEYCSSSQGVSHACGHDVHTTAALGAAMLLCQHPPTRGRVRFLFQPAEETINAEGKSGATLMLEEGALEGAGAAIALHVFPDIKVGTIAVKEGPLLAACDSFEIRVKGVATHGAYPQHGVDAVVLASQVVQSIQTIMSRRKSALDPAIVTLGGIRSTTYRPNIVAEEVQIVGTARYFSEHLGPLIQSELHKACAIAECLGGAYEISYTKENPAVTNHPLVVEAVRQAAAKVLGEGSVQEAHLEMGADDFSFISQALPSCYFLLGAEIEGDRRMVHTPTFDIDEKAIPLGAALLAQGALECLERLAP